MSEHTPLTEAEREALRRELDTREGSPRHRQMIAFVERLLAARTSTATADTGLRERVERLCDEFGQATLGTDFFGNPLGGFVPVAHLRALLLDPPMDLLDATAAPTTDTGARDE